MCRSRPVPSDNCQAIYHCEPSAIDVNRIHKGTQILSFSKAASFVFSTCPSHFVAARVSDWTFSHVYVSTVWCFGGYHYHLTFWAFAPLRSYFSVTICPSFCPNLLSILSIVFSTHLLKDGHLWRLSLPSLPLSSALLYSFVHNAFYTRNSLILCFWSSDWNRKSRYHVSAVVAPWPTQVFGTEQSK